MIVYPDGKVVARGGRAVLNPGGEDRDCICNNGPLDDRQFDRWLESVAVPNWRERTAADRERFIWQPGFLLVFYAVLWGAGMLLTSWIKSAWQAMFD